RAFPAARCLAGELANRSDRVADRSALVLDVMHRPLHEAVAHELPSGVERCLRNARIAATDRAVDRKRRLNAELLQYLAEAPEADAHAVFVPGPVRQVR